MNRGKNSVKIHRMFNDFFEELPLIGVLRGIDMNHLKPVAQATLDAGVRILEITLNTPDAPKLIEAAAAEFGNKMAIGAGTVLNKQNAELAVQAGAKYLVSPQCDPAIAAYCRDNDIPYIPGALTPTEIYNAWQQSHVAVKVFPASIFGPSYIDTLVNGPFDGLKLLVTGGVDINNAEEYLENGAFGISIGAGTAYKKEWIASKNWEAITNLLSQYVAIVKSRLR